jgi:hypothetical protein
MTQWTSGRILGVALLRAWRSLVFSRCRAARSPRSSSLRCARQPARRVAALGRRRVGHALLAARPD